ncbi:hypothetical protein ACWHLZ_43635 [Streptomyces chartreusis]
MSTASFTDEAVASTAGVVSHASRVIPNLTSCINKSSRSLRIRAVSR